MISPGICICAEGWAGVDCTIDLRTGPRVGALGNNGLCDVRTRPCRNLIILGDNFANRPDLSCTFEVFKVIIIPTRPISSSMIYGWERMRRISAGWVSIFDLWMRLKLNLAEWALFCVMDEIEIYSSRMNHYL